ncbi:MAG TPA: ADP-ribosylglycohydrolase family protein, partial [Candidatus Ozemobacteraceae bacterium]
LAAADDRSRRAFAPFFTAGIDTGPPEPATGGPEAPETARETLFAAFRALKHAASFEHGIGLAIAQGGDATVRGAVAGALLGARFGRSGIPDHLVSALRRGRELEDRLQGRLPPDTWETSGEASLQDGHLAGGGLLGGAPPALIRFIWLLRRLHQMGIDLVRWLARQNVKVTSLLTGWLTDDVYFVRNEDRGEEALGFGDEQRRDTMVLRLLIGAILLAGILQIVSTYRHVFLRLSNLDWAIFRPAAKTVSTPKFPGEGRSAPGAGPTPTAAATHTVLSADPLPGKTSGQRTAPFFRPEALEGSPPSPTGGTPTPVPVEPTRADHKTANSASPSEGQAPDARCPTCGSWIRAGSHSPGP